MNHENPRIAVVFASAQGSTRAVADYIGADLAGRGALVEVADAEHAPDLSRFDAVILGSAVHNADVLPGMTDFARSHHQELRDRPVWLFTVGMGPALRGPIGHRLAAVVPKKIAALRDSLNAVSYHAFAGRFEQAGVAWWARAVYRLAGGARYGDLRDWPAIVEWTATVASALRLPGSATSVVYP
ncbi:putative flavodoxin [Nocardia nova SH22a]|uniref:Putative flavodoxin n=1 Tax=Nocardia nova SH22a TaxID=1415166 RepID=W5TJY7_9NOCA|nr:flavodoxin domain-containing protein [Nocardia nova]AHH19675.1 putative flavodoxin [Nocardia nova SH22a]